MKEAEIKAHMSAAEVYAELSHCQRRKVGAILVKGNRVLSIGVNGTPSGFDNCCEEKEYMPVDAPAWLDTEEITDKWPYVDDKGRYSLTTKEDVLHAESNLLAKLARSHESSEGASLFVTLAPCLECSKLIYQAGIKEVFYKEEYRCTKGLDFLNKTNINATQIK